MNLGVKIQLKNMFDWFLFYSGKHGKQILNSENKKNFQKTLNWCLQ